MLADRDVLPLLEDVTVKLVTRLIIVRVSIDVVMEGPGPPAVVDQVTLLIVLVRPEPPDPALGAVLAPPREVDVAALTERRHEFIATIVATLGGLGIAGAGQGDDLEAIALSNERPLRLRVNMRHSPGVSRRSGPALTWVNACLVRCV